MIKLLLTLLLAATLSLMAEPSTAAVAIAAQTDPAKLATLKSERAANPRLQKCVYWLAYAEEQGEKPEAVLDESAKLNKTAGTPYAGFLRWGLLENLKIAKELGLLTPEGMAELRRGKSATITKGQYSGQKAEADHVIPRAICRELANQVMNLELLPASLNRAESDKVTYRASVFAKELYDAKLLSEEGWEAVRKAYKNEVVVQPPPLVEIEAPEQNPVRDEPPPPLSIPFIPPLNMGAAVKEGLTETTGEWTYIVGDVVAIVASSTATGAVTIPRKLGGLPVLMVGYSNSPVFGFNNTSVTSVTIPSGVNGIGKRAFFGCKNLISVNIPNSVTRIGSSAFYQCYKLTNITIPNRCHIEAGAFYGCIGLPKDVLDQIKAKQ